MKIRRHLLLLVALSAGCSESSPPPADTPSEPVTPAAVTPATEIPNIIVELPEHDDVPHEDDVADSAPDESGDTPG